jgi:hypothetical protein
MVSIRALTSLYTRGKDPGTHWTGGWVGPRAVLDTKAIERILSSVSGIEPRSPGCQVRSKTLY